MDYLDFEIEIGHGKGRIYPVNVVHSAGGELHTTMHFPFDELALEKHLLELQNALLRSGGRRRQVLLPEEQDVQQFGRTLFEALFAGEVGTRYAVSQVAAANQGKGLRVKLRILAPELASLPWEFLYDPCASEYLSLSSTTPIVRYLELAQPPQPLLMTPPLSILGMVPSPKDLPGLDVDREKLRLERALKDLQARGVVKLTWLPGQTWQDLQRAMRRGPWHIFHFIGHGGFDARTDQGLVALENEEGNARLLTATDLGRLLGDHRSLRLVVLNSCEGARSGKQDIFSSTATILVRHRVPAVLAMQYEITDRAAIELSRAFYEALADGSSVDMALSDARKAISVEIPNTLEWGTPVLYTHSPDGVLFDLREKPSVAHELPDKESPRINPEEQPHKAEEFTLIASLSPGWNLFRSVYSVAISPNGQTLVSGSDDKKIRIWNLSTKECIHTLKAISFFSYEDIIQGLEDTIEGVTSVAISPDGQTIVSGSTDHTIKIWSLPTGGLLRTLHPVYVTSVAISPDGQTIVGGNGDNTIKIWSLPTGELLRTLTGHSLPVRSVAISPDGQTIVSGSTDHTIKVWSLSTGELVRTLTGHLDCFESVAISPDGQTTVSGSWDNTIKVWSLSTGELLRTLTGHSDQVSSVAISPDGQTIVSGSGDHTVKIWNLHTGELLRTLTGHSRYVTSVAISSDGQTIVSGSWDNTIKVWRKG